MLNLSTVPYGYQLRVAAIWLALPLLAAIACPVVRGAQNDDKQEKKEVKKEKPDAWIELRTNHFVVTSDGGEKEARHVADQFEQVRRAFQATMPNARLSTGIPIQILAAKNGQSFAKIFPEFPPDKRREQPAGSFVEGPEKIYIGIRTNVSGPAPYEEIYRDYARLVLKLSYHNLPPWLEEGYSNVYGSLVLTDKGPRLARPDPDDMSVLFESPLLPLDLIFQVDRNSAYYTVGEKNTVYFAESRALVHFLISDPQMSGSQALDQYIAKVEGGADSLATARQVFGDLDQLQSNLESYIKETKASPAEIAGVGGGDSGGTAKTLSSAAAGARIGDFLAQHGRADDAEDKLEEALKLDPSLAEAEQSLGFVELQLKHLEDADQHFTRSVQLDPKDALTYYGQGQVAMTRGGFVGVPVGAVVAFEKTVSLNPDFAPAWDSLASIYANRADTLQKALTDEQHAVSLEPGERRYQNQVAAILDLIHHSEETRNATAPVQSSSSDSKAPNTNRDASEGASSQPQTSMSASSTSNASVPAASGGSVRIERKTEPDQPPAASLSKRNEPDLAPPPIAAPNTRTYSMLGTITDVNCANAPQIQITLKASTIVMHLHAGDLGQVTIKSSGSSAPAKNTSCASLRGRSVRVSYQLVSDQKWDGEMQSVEFR